MVMVICFYIDFMGGWEANNFTNIEVDTLSFLRQVQPTGTREQMCIYIRITRLYILDITSSLITTNCNNFGMIYVLPC